MNEPLAEIEILSKMLQKISINLAIHIESAHHTYRCPEQLLECRMVYKTLG